MGKITINHYLNKTVKPRFNGKVNTYPIYIQVIADKINYKMKSNFDYGDGYISFSDYNSDFVRNSLNKEKQEIEKVVSYLIKNEKKEFLNADGFKKLSANFWDTLNNNFWIRFAKEAQENIEEDLPNAFYKATFFDISEILHFTESKIKNNFSDEYYYVDIGMEAMWHAVLMKKYGITSMTVCDFLFDSDKRANVLEAIKDKHIFHGGDEKNEYNNVLQAIESIIFGKEE
jgi:hypothetical protein